MIKTFEKRLEEQRKKQKLMVFPKPVQDATSEMLNDLAKEIETLDKDNDTLRVEITELWRAIDKLKSNKK